MNVVLREVTASDLPILFEHQRDPEAARLVPTVPRDREAFFAHMEKTSRDPVAIRRAIVVEGEVVGMVGQFERDGVPEVFYQVAREHWGKGVATAALAALLAEVRRRPLHARAAKRNPGSVRVLQKCGFAITGEDRYTPEGLDLDVEEFVFTLL